MTVTGGGKGGRGAWNTAEADVTCFFMMERGISSLIAQRSKPESS